MLDLGGAGRHTSLPASRELLLLGDLSFLRGQEEQLALTAPLLSVPGSLHCSSLHPTPSEALEALLSSLLLLAMKLTGRRPQNYPREVRRGMVVIMVIQMA